MKVTPKNTTYILAVAIIYTMISAFVNILGLLINHPLNGMTSYRTELLMECTYLISIFYIRDVLRYLNEPKSITLTFYIYISLSLLAALGFLFAPHGMLAIYIRAAFDFAAFAAKIYFIIQLFRINNLAFSKYFSALAISMLMAIFFKLVENLLKIQHWQRKFINPFIFLSGLIPAFIIIFILYKIFLHLNNEQKIFKQAALSADEPA